MSRLSARIFHLGNMPFVMRTRGVGRIGFSPLNPKVCPCNQSESDPIRSKKNQSDPIRS